MYYYERNVLYGVGVIESVVAREIKLYKKRYLLCDTPWLAGFLSASAD